MGYDLVHPDTVEPAGPGSSVRFVRRVPLGSPVGTTMIAVGARHGSDEPRGPF